MRNELPVATSSTPIEMMEPLRLSFLAAVKRIDRLRQEVFSCDGQTLITQADTNIDRLAESFKARGCAPVGDVMALVKFAGHMDNYVHEPDSSHLSLAQTELGNGLMAAA